jgi:hypothetical protein
MNLFAGRDDFQAASLDRVAMLVCCMVKIAWMADRPSALTCPLAETPMLLRNLWTAQYLSLRRHRRRHPNNPGPRHDRASAATSQRYRRPITQGQISLATFHTTTHNLRNEK